MSKYPNVTSRIIRMVEMLKTRRQETDHDIIAIVEEPIGRMTPHSALEAFSNSTVPSTSRAVCNDCFVHFVQIGFGTTELLLDIPNTAISAAEAETLIRARRGFHFEQDRTQVASRFNPLQKIHLNGDEVELAEDIAHIFIELWLHPSEVPLKLLFD